MKNVMSPNPPARAVRPGAIDAPEHSVNRTRFVQAETGVGLDRPVWR